MMISFFLLNELNFCKRKKTYHYRCYWRKYNGKKTFFFLLLYLENIIIKRSFSISTCTMFFFFFFCFIFVIFNRFKLFFQNSLWTWLSSSYGSRYGSSQCVFWFTSFICVFCLSIFIFLRGKMENFFFLSLFHPSIAHKELMEIFIKK